MSTFHRKRCRRFIHVTLLILMIIGIIFGTFSLFLAQYYKVALSRHVGKIEKDTLSISFCIFQLYGLHVIINYCYGIILVNKCSFDPYTIHLGTLLNIWNTFVLIACLDGLWLYNWLSNSIESIQKSVELSMLHGIVVYYSQPDWRLIWDDLQQRHKCCGIYNFLDWELSLKAYVFDDDEMDKNNIEKNNTKLKSVVPYSCCREGVDCYRSYYFLTHKSIGLFEHHAINVSDINTNGCFEYLKKLLNTSTTHVLVVTIVIFINQICILILMRFLYLKNRNFAKSINAIDSECQTFSEEKPFNVNTKIELISENNITSENQRHVTFNLEQRRKCKCSSELSPKASEDEGEETPLLIH